jgi:hypothetical protein
MRQRMEKFALSLHPEKTRLIEFGRYAAERRARRGLGKPETFNFLGFTRNPPPVPLRFPEPTGMRTESKLLKGLTQQ